MITNNILRKIIRKFIEEYQSGNITDDTLNSFSNKILKVIKKKYKYSYIYTPDKTKTVFKINLNKTRVFINEELLMKKVEEVFDIPLLLSLIIKQLKDNTYSEDDIVKAAIATLENIDVIFSY